MTGPDDFVKYIFAFRCGGGVAAGARQRGEGDQERGQYLETEEQARLKRGASLPVGSARLHFQAPDATAKFHLLTHAGGGPGPQCARQHAFRLAGRGVGDAEGQLLLRRAARARGAKSRPTSNMPMTKPRSASRRASASTMAASKPER
jgi:hypothetical protein